MSIHYKNNEHPIRTFTKFYLDCKEFYVHKDVIDVFDIKRWIKFKELPELNISSKKSYSKMEYMNCSDQEKFHIYQILLGQKFNQLDTWEFSV